jgi:hypothetical protein
MKGVVGRLEKDVDEFDTVQSSDCLLCFDGRRVWRGAYGGGYYNMLSDVVIVVGAKERL